MFTALSLLVQVYGPDICANQGLQGKDKYDILNSQYQEDDAKSSRPHENFNIRKVYQACRKSAGRAFL
jgi:hypothetical protein